MAAIRQRFTPAERKAFTTGTEVEYLDVTRWYPATVDGPIATDTMEQQYLPLARNHPRTRTQPEGLVRAWPKHVRLPQEQREGKYV